MIKIFCDGACSGNPGPGGYGTILQQNGKVTELSGGEAHTTNNRMELLGAIAGLEALPEKTKRVSVTTDSLYVFKGIMEWFNNWQRRGWKTAKGKPVLNRDLWERLDLARKGHKVTWYWVKGHAGHAENERCDQLAREAIKR